MKMTFKTLEELIEYEIDNPNAKELALDKLKKVIEETEESLKIVKLLKTKRGYIKSKKGKIMRLQISHITYNGSQFMVNGWCIDSDNHRTLSLDKVYLSEEALSMMLTNTHRVCNDYLKNKTLNHL